MLVPTNQNYFLLLNNKLVRVLGLALVVKSTEGYVCSSQCRVERKCHDNRPELSLRDGHWGPGISLICNEDDPHLLAGETKGY